MTGRHTRRRAARMLAGTAALALGACVTAGEDATPRPRLAWSGMEDTSRPAGQLYAAARLHLAEGRLGLAVQALSAARAADPRDIDVLNALGVAYDRMGRHELAAEAYRAALAIDPDDPVTLNNAGWSNMLRGRPEVAAAYLSRAAAAAPDDPVVAANVQAVGRRIALERRDTPGSRHARAAPGPRVERTDDRGYALVGAPPDRSARAWLAAPPPLAAVAGTPAPAAVAATSALPAPRAGIGDGVTLVVANGAGRSGMAARVRGWLWEQGLDRPARLANARPFTHRRTHILHTPAERPAAQALAGLLPVGVELREVAGPAATLRLVLGADLLDLDAAITAKGARFATAAAPGAEEVPT